MSDFSNALKAGGATSIGLVLLWSLSKDLIVKSSPLSSELTFTLLGLALFFIFILAFKIIGKDKVTRNSGVSIKGDASGSIITGDGNSIGNQGKEVTKERADSRDSSVKIGGSSTSNIITGDSDSIEN